MQINHNTNKSLDKDFLDDVVNDINKFLKKEDMDKYLKDQHLEQKIKKSILSNIDVIGDIIYRMDTNELDAQIDEFFKEEEDTKELDKEIAEVDKYLDEEYNYPLMTAQKAKELSNKNQENKIPSNWKEKVLSEINDNILYSIKSENSNCTWAGLCPIYSDPRFFLTYSQKIEIYQSLKDKGYTVQMYSEPKDGVFFLTISW